MKNPNSLKKSEKIKNIKKQVNPKIFYIFGYQFVPYRLNWLEFMMCLFMLKF